MKKLFALILSFVLMFSVTAFSESNLKVTHKNLIAFPGDDTGYFYARIENESDVPVGVSTGDLVVFSTSDEIIISDGYITTLPSYVLLEPGEYLYVYDFIWDSALENAEIGDYKFSMPVGKSSTGIEKHACESTLEIEGVGTYENYVYVTFNNETDAPIEDAFIVAAIYDQNENLIFADSYSLNSLIVNPHSSVTAKCYIDEELMEYYVANDIAPTRTDAYVCIGK